jgi:uncharacterized protein (TIGR03435 family)
VSHEQALELPNETFARRFAAAGILSSDQLNEPTGTSAPKAMQRLGLKLEKRRLPIQVLVVDGIEPAPTEN